MYKENSSTYEKRGSDHGEGLVWAQVANQENDPIVHRGGTKEQHHRRGHTLVQEKCGVVMRNQKQTGHA